VPKTESVQPFFSVIVPAYNTYSTIAETIDSVLAQTYQNYEIIVVDDGSPDDVADFVERTYGEAVSLIRQPNGGLASARNAGIKVATGDYVAFLDSDDAWLPTKLERQVEQIKAHPDGAVFYTNCYFYKDGERTGQWIDQHKQQDGDIAVGLINRQVMLPILTTVVQTAALEQAGGFRAELRQVEDYDLWLRLAIAGKTFYSLSEPLALYRINPDGLSQNTLLMAETQLGIYQKLLLRAPEPLVTDMRIQIKIYRLEVLHQKRSRALNQHKNVQAALYTLRMIGKPPQTLLKLIVTAILILAYPPIRARYL
jgi:glycosyltransferase involved in cell wall biosynthesis